MRLAIAFVYALAVTFTLILPSAAAQSSATPQIAGLAFVQVESAKGTLDVLAAPSGWCIARLHGDADDDGMLPVELKMDGGGMWHGPFRTSALDALQPPGQIASTAGVTHCFAMVIPGVGVGALPTILTTGPQTFSHSASTLGAAVAGVQQQVAAMMANGWVPIPCGTPPAGGSGSG